MGSESAGLDLTEEEWEELAFTAYVEAGATFLTEIDADRVLLVLESYGPGEHHAILNPAQGPYAVEGEQVEPVAPDGGFRDIEDIEVAVGEERTR